MMRQFILGDGYGMVAKVVVVMVVMVAAVICYIVSYKSKLFHIYKYKIHIKSYYLPTDAFVEV
jgi:hypothetical protein